MGDLLHNEARWGKVPQSAKYAGVSPRTFRKWLKEGLRHSRLPSGTILTNRCDIDDFIRKWSRTENETENLVNEIMNS